MIENINGLTTDNLENILDPANHIQINSSANIDTEEENNALNE